MANAPVITIDGPSGSGKGAVCAVVAERLGFALLDSGALYRVLGIAVHKAGVDLANQQEVADLASAMTIEFIPDTIIVRLAPFFPIHACQVSEWLTFGNGCML